ncbi:MAG: cytochrome c [Chloroflexi bacterium]|nr:MAG: cytochrome c [Chloroflexota bacterium]
MKPTALLCLIMVVLFAACQSKPSPEEAVAALPVGNPANGAELFHQSIDGAPSCASCHALDSSRLVGPGMAGYGERAATRVDGESAEVYTYHSITTPAAYLVAGYSNLMYTEYSRKLDDQQLADLIAFLLQQ